MADGNEQVKLYVYDLSMGLAQDLSQALLNKRVDGIWHTSIVIFDKEHYFGQSGVIVSDPGHTQLGQPQKIEVLGVTQVTKDLFHDYLDGLKNNEFAPGTYNLFKHNCNNFSNELAQFLVGEGIPKYILDLPQEVLNSVGQISPIVQILTEFIDTDFRGSSPDYDSLNNDIDAARQRSAALDQKRTKIQQKLERQEKKKKKKKKRDKTADNVDIDNNYFLSNRIYRRRLRMAENVNGDTCQNGNKGPAEISAEIDEQDKKEREEKRKQREPPIIFPNLINVQEEFDKVIGLVDGVIQNEEMQFFEELHQYMLEDEGSWALSDGFLSFIGKMLSDTKFSDELRVGLLKVLAAAALKEDMILVLHQDRREHIFMNYANNFDRLSVEEQKSLALFVCNLFESPSSSEWLLYISEWESGTNSISNIRVTTKIAANSLLSENPDLQNYGSAIIHNLACKEVFDDVAVELTMAVLQFFNGNPDEEKVFRCLKALAKFIQVSQQDVSQLVQMIGPHPNKYRGLSERVDNLVGVIEQKLR